MFPERNQSLLGLLSRSGCVFVIILVFLENMAGFKRLALRVLISSSRVQNKLCSEMVQKLLSKNKEIQKEQYFSIPKNKEMALKNNLM